MSVSPWSRKTAVVCGASAGLGRDFARELARQKVSRLALISRSVENLDTVRGELLAADDELQILCLPADLRVQSEVQQAAQHIHRDFGSVDVLVQAVGQSDRGRVTDVTDSRLHDLIEANVLTSLHALQSFEAVMSRPGGSIVLVGSLASKFAPRYLGGYAIAKHGLAALAQQARLELAEQGLHVMLACPGPIARADAPSRYDQIAVQRDLPAAVRLPGGGAKIKGLDASQFVRDALRAAASNKPQLIRPLKAQWLLWLSAISCRLGDHLLRKNSA